MRRRGLVTRDVHVRFGLIGNADGDPPPPPPEDAIAAARAEAEVARANAARLQRDLEEARRAQPTDEQRARWAQLEADAARAEEERMRRAGEFDNLRTQLTERHGRELEAERTLRANAEALRQRTESELRETLIGLEFRGATDLFGPTGKTVLLPEVAQSYFSSHVEVETIPAAGGLPERRRVVVKDKHGQVIVDPKNGQPMPFAKAMLEVIEGHPQKDHLLRGSGKVGAGSSGGANGAGDGVDLTSLTTEQFQDPKIRDAVRASQSRAGGLQVGPAFDRIRNRASK
jgi:hypothetical protein